MLINHEVSQRLGKSFSLTVHCLVSVKRIVREIAVLLIHANFLLLVHCWNTVLKVGSVFSPLPLPASHLLFTAQDSDGLYLLKICMCCFHFFLVDYEWGLGIFLCGRENSEWLSKCDAQKRAGICEFLVFIWCLSIMIILIWVIGIPQNNGKVPGIFLPWRIP